MDQKPPISASIYDLNNTKSRLQQRKSDLKSPTNSPMPPLHRDKKIPEDRFSAQQFILELQEMQAREQDITNLLSQFPKPLYECRLGFFLLYDIV